MRRIDADAKITALLYDEEHEETNRVEMTIADFLDSHTEEGCPQNGGWISVKDRLPDGKTNPVTLDFNEVICFCDFGGDPKRTDVRTYKFGTMLGCTRPHFWHGPQIMDDVVTHWQYLPEPPKES